MANATRLIQIGENLYKYEDVYGHPLGEDGICYGCGLDVGLLGLRSPHTDLGGAQFIYPEMIKAGALAKVDKS